MDRQDDPAITGVLYRRIPPDNGKVKWDGSGTPIISKSNFQDRKDELSVYIAAETTPDRALAGHDGFGLAQVTAESIRSICQGRGIIICRDEEEPADGHVLVCGNITDGLAKGIQKAATWVDGRWPRRELEEDVGGVEVG